MLQVESLEVGNVVIVSWWFRNGCGRCWIWFGSFANGWWL